MSPIPAAVRLQEDNGEDHDHTVKCYHYPLAVLSASVVSYAKFVFNANNRNYCKYNILCSNIQRIIRESQTKDN